jgi:small subunit ribosomal protein S3
MGQKVSPIGFRTGITIGWKSRWYAPKGSFGEFLVEDTMIRRFIDDRLNRQPPYAAISSVEIERTREEVKVILRTARPGLVIGPKGAEVDKLKAALEDLTDRRVNINILEVKSPDLDARLVAEGIAEQLKRRTSFRRTMKQRAEGAMQAGAKGVKITISGRLGGAEMSRTETQIIGSIPLHTLEADVDYAYVPCFTTYGAIGVKVWIYRGLFGEATEEPDQASARAMTRARRRRERGEGAPGGRGGPRTRAASPRPRPSRTRAARPRAGRQRPEQRQEQGEARAADEKGPEEEGPSPAPPQTEPPPPESQSKADQENV